MQHQKPATIDSQKKLLPVVIQHSFNDVDELAEVSRDWNLDFRQLDRGGFQGDVVQALLGPLHLARTRLGGVLHQQGATPAGLWTFGIPRAREMDHCWRGHRMDRDDLLIHRPGCEFESVSKYDFDLLLISVSGESLENAGRRLGDAGLRPFSDPTRNRQVRTSDAEWIAPSREFGPDSGHRDSIDPPKGRDRQDHRRPGVQPPGPGSGAVSKIGPTLPHPDSEEIGRVRHPYRRGACPRGPIGQKALHRIGSVRANASKGLQ